SRSSRATAVAARPGRGSRLVLRPVRHCSEAASSPAGTCCHACGFAVAVERLQKILSNAGVTSRRRAEELIAEGRVAINGTVVTTPGARADTERDVVTVDGVPVVRTAYHYVALNKPA